MEGVPHFGHQILVPGANPAISSGLLQVEQHQRAGQAELVAMASKPGLERAGLQQAGQAVVGLLLALEFDLLALVALEVLPPFAFEPLV
eukprot:CAMPEP_0175153636 /NCGR_PEP_ID=MMETSP0087-20121206/19858_1 /TAXON_ID=136419 /ORGANISM="Unknown Unknown, Strain D1" /LENGTH=88 /DNA_ID=CAMNT_0016440359 /DNA_START=125 /DNA_END=392 /DNA_ORIENTATION=-